MRTQRKGIIVKFGGIGVTELLIILAVVLLIFGPKNLPKLGSAVGRTVKNLREGMNSAPDIKIDDEDEKKTADESDDQPQAEGERKLVKRRKKPAEDQPAGGKPADEE